MKKVFKMTLFKKILITTLTGLLVILISFMYMIFQVEKEDTIRYYFENYKNHYSLESIQKIFEDSLDNPELEFDKAMDILNSNEFHIQFLNHTNSRWEDDIVITYWLQEERVSSIYPDKYFIKTTYDREYDYIELEGKEYSLEMLSQAQKESLLKYLKKHINDMDENGYPLMKYEYCIDNNQISYLKWENNEYGSKSSNVKEEYGVGIFYLLDHCAKQQIGSSEIMILNLNELEEAIQSIQFTFNDGVSGKDVIEINDRTYFISAGYIAGTTHDGDNRLINIFSVEVAENFDEEVFKVSFDKYKLIIFFSFIIMLFVSWYLSTILVYPIKQLEKSALKISNNEFDEEVKIKSNDEIGSLAHSIDTMRLNLKDTIDQLNNEIEKVKGLESLRKDFINQFTHEMKTPLGIINGYSELIEETDDEEERQRYLDIINKETVRINDLIQSMLRLSRLEAGKVELNKEILDLEDIVTEIVDEYEILLMKKSIRVEVNIIDKNLNGDRNQIITVIRNFLSNAIKYTNTRIIITVDQGVSVYNEGLPIEEDRLESIWYTFVTHDKSGTGLGLAICRSILELHNYKYGVLNRNNGVEFYFCE